MCFFYVNCWFFVVFPRPDSVGQLLSAHETHNQYPLLTQFGSTNDSVGWLPADHHLLVLLQRPQQHQQKQQHVLLQHRCPCCCYTGCCCNTRRCNTRYRANITPVQAVIFWPRLATLQQQQSSSPVRHRYTRNLVATFGQKMPLSGPTSRSCTGVSVRCERH